MGLCHTDVRDDSVFMLASDLYINCQVGVVGATDNHIVSSHIDYIRPFEDVVGSLVENLIKSV
jgi:hypothetical protein